MRLVGILLAAGEGSRFGGDKLLAPLASDRASPGIEPVGVVAARNLLAALPDSIAVVRPHDTTLATVLSAAGMRITVCENASDGMGASLACGVAAADDAAGWVIALADMPWISPATIRVVVDAIASGSDIAAPSLRGARGHPVGFARTYREALMSLTGDAGARSLIERNAARVTWIDVDDEGVLRDVDNVADLR